jgi:hypothetical protein
LMVEFRRLHSCLMTESFLESKIYAESVFEAGDFVSGIL